MIVLDGHDGLVNALAYSPDGRTLATGGSDGRVKLWDALAGRELRSFSRPRPVSSLSFSNDGRLLAAGVLGEACVWSVASGQLLRQHRMTSEADPSPFSTYTAFHPSEERLAIAYPRQAIIEVEPLGDRRQRTLSHQAPSYSHRHPLDWRSLRYLHSGTLAAGMEDFTVLWPFDVISATDASPLHWPNGHVVSLSSDAAGRWLAAARGRGVALYDVLVVHSDLRRVRTLSVGEQVNAVALTPDGRTLLAGGEDWIVHVWDAPSGQKRTDFNWRVGPVTALAVSPDGMTAAVCGRKGPQVLIWDLE